MQKFSQCVHWDEPYKCIKSLLFCSNTSRGILGEIEAAQSLVRCEQQGNCSEKIKFGHRVCEVFV